MVSFGIGCSLTNNFTVIYLMKKQLSTHDFEDVYKKLGININDLGCVMLDIEKGAIENLLNEEDLYYTPKKELFWIKGFVGKKAHLTLLYGLLKPAKLYAPYIKKVLKGWELKTITVEKVSFFESTFKDEPYYCIIAEAKVTPALLEGHERLQFLPHIDTFTGYKAHITIAYIKKDKKLRTRVIRDYTELLEGKKLKTAALNLGGDKS